MPTPTIRAHWSHKRRTLGVDSVAASVLDVAAAEAGDVGTTTVEVRFTQNVNATDYKAGVTIKVNSISQTINSATRQADHRYVYYVIASAADADDVITWEYDSGAGDYQDDEGNPMGDISAVTVTNYIATHFYFDTADDSAWLGAVT
jgi:hypothetical protein